MGDRAGRIARWVLVGMTVQHVLEALIVRSHRQQVTGLPTPGSASGDDLSGHVDLVAVEGSFVDKATLAGVAAEMRATGAEVVDLVPGDLPVERAYRLARSVEPERLVDPLYVPGGAHEAVALHRSVAERIGVAGGASVDCGVLIHHTADAQRYAPTSAVVRLAPQLRATPTTPADRWRELEVAMAFAEPNFALAPAWLAMELVQMGVLSVAVVLAPWPGILAAASWSAQPLLVFSDVPAGTEAAAWTPRRLLWDSLLRLPLAWVEKIETAVAGFRATRERRDSQAALASRKPVTTPPEAELFEARRDTCPWCSSEALEPRLDTTDLLQFKPGEFHLDECQACGHIFQNPALSPRGLDYYYEQAYDGVHGEMAEAAFGAMPLSYQGRIDAVARFAEPRTWLDVGAGHGHFCLMARQRWPEGRFDGVDLSESVEEAQRRGWLDTAYRGLFPDLADGLPRTYDVVSMHHYLEHTRQPYRELAAAAKVLEPGGHLMIEVPDTASPWSRRLGRFWAPWFQPQHQHFVTCDNLTAALRDAGMEIVSVERGPATTGGELTFATLLALQHLVPHRWQPWLPAPSRSQRAKRAAILVASLPLVGVLAAVDTVRDAGLRRPDNPRPSDAYRVVARRV
jgi:SAM-dependent methyltransferase